MNYHATLPIPTHKQLKRWLNKWGQLLSNSDEFVETPDDYIPIDTMLKREQKSIIIITDQNLGLSSFYQQVVYPKGIEDEPIDEQNTALQDFISNHLTITNLIQSLRKLRDNDTDFSDFDLYNIRYAYACFCHQYSTFPEASGARKLLSLAWENYYKMLFSNSMEDLLNPAPPLQVEPDIEAAANKLRRMAKNDDLDLQDKTFDGIYEMLAAVARSVDFHIESFEIDIYGEITIKIAQEHLLDNNSQNKITAFISAICKTLDTDLLSGIVYDEMGGTITFTLEKTPNHFIDFDLFKAVKTARSIYEGKEPNIDLKISFLENTKPELTMAEKVINAAFLGVGLGTLEKIFINEDNNRITIKLPNYSPNSVRLSEEQETDLIELALTAIRNGTGVNLEFDDEYEYGGIIYLNALGYNTLPELETVQPSTIRDIAKALQNKQRGNGPDGLSGWGKGGVS